MNDRLNQFHWIVAKNGYKILPHRQVGTSLDRLHLTNSARIGANTPGSIYVPPSGLFLAFAKLKPRQNRILEFADQWGMLTRGKLLSVGGPPIVGEPVDVWLDEIEDLALAVKLWESLKSRDTRSIGRFIKWASDSSGVRFQAAAPDLRPPRESNRWIATREVNPDLLSKFHVGDLITPAWLQLQHMVNEKLDGRVSARLLWNGSYSRLSLYQVPGDLISALWLQLGRAVDGDREYQQCEECRNWFEISSPDGGRKDKRFCGSACRARKWRRAKDDK
jgi:hypothetical protein